MAQLDALRLAEALRTRLVDFVADEHFTRDPTLCEICRAIWSGPSESGGLIGDLWVEGSFPAKLSEFSLADLVREGRFSPDLCGQLDSTGAVPRERRLYTHQYEALMRSAELGPEAERPAVVVTAGTGAGKTEAFLLPVLNDLYTRSDSGGSGCKCIILYPMNALVNDQVDRLYSWLQGQDEVTLFHFTSETPEDKSRADKDGVPVWEACRLRTRQQARGKQTAEGRTLPSAEQGPVPDIVITNYSMLEYMLCRPQDAPFFGPSLRAIVLDEAHLYTGTLAAEITLLLRRLYARCGVTPQNVLQIATSATLGSGEPEELRRFVATLFTKDEGLVRLVAGERSRSLLPSSEAPATPVSVSAMGASLWLDRPLIVAQPEGAPELARDTELCDRLRQRLPLLVADEAVAAENTVDRPAALLHNTLKSAPKIHELEHILWEHERLPLRELSAALWGDDDAESVRATAHLLQLAASARLRVGDYPLVPHRLHLLARASEGIGICLSPHCSGPPGRTLDPLGNVFSGLSDCCPECGSAALALHRCTNCGQWVLAGRQNGDRIRPALLETEPHPDTRFFTPREVAGAAAFSVDPSTGERFGVGMRGVNLYTLSTCPGCEAERAAFAPFTSTAHLALSIVAETVLQQLPEFPSADKEWLPARGRRMLAFSDSRQEAARLGPRLRRQHETQLIRTAVIESLHQNMAVDSETIADAQADIARLQSRVAEPALTPAQRQRLEQQLNVAEQQLRDYSAGGSIGDWAKALAAHSVLAEVLDSDMGGRHSPPRQTSGDSVGWSQRDWEGNWRQIRQRSASLLAQEFARRPPRGVTAETLGLAEITYPGIQGIAAPPELLGVFGTQQVREALAGAWPDILSAFLDTLRADGAITLGTDDEDREYPHGARLVSHWCSLDQEGWALIRFTGTTRAQRRRWFGAAVLEGCGLSKAEAEEHSPRLLQAAFRQLLDHAYAIEEGPAPAHFPWLQRSLRQVSNSLPTDAIRLHFPGLALRRPVGLFRCERTGHVWPRSVLGCAPESGCAGTLRPVTDGDLDHDPRLGRQRREYAESPVFRIGLWAEEHSAQLSPKENRRLQDLFKAGVRNLLSATTTLELGIDIGGLNAVLMSNVPPGKANYLQRAGRAGRRADGSSVVVTFARPRPFDREVFGRFGDYLDRPLRRPLVFLQRERVTRRHLHAFLLGGFFQAIYPADRHVGAMRAFGDMGVFCARPFPRKSEPQQAQKQFTPPLEITLPDGAADLPWWNRPIISSALDDQFRNYLAWLRDHEEVGLRRAVAGLLRETGLEAALNNWKALLQGVSEAFTASVKRWQEDYDTLWKVWEATEPGPVANALCYQLRALYELTVIEALADQQYLPRYGFPIGVQKLRVVEPDPERLGKIREEDQYRLSRGSLLALGEYVPGSQLMAGGKLVSSHGLLKHWAGADVDNYLGLRGQYCRCVNEHFHYWVSGEAPACPLCHAPPCENPQPLLFPKHGFSGAAWDPPRWGTDVDRIGETETATITFTQSADGRTHRHEDEFAGIAGLSAQYQEDGKLLVYNRGDKGKGFAICLRCGYAESEQHLGVAAMKLPTGFIHHAPLRARSRSVNCWPKDTVSVLRNQVLAAHETTDVLLLDFTNCLHMHRTNRPLVETLAYALQRAGTRLLELDTREVGVLIVPAGDGGRGLGAVLYDSVPGGAGHVLELLTLGREWVQEARTTLFVDANHHQRCETACLDCLLSFDAQGIPFDRRLAIGVLDALLAGSPLPGAPDPHCPCESPSAREQPKPSKSERLLAARQRRIARR